MIEQDELIQKFLDKSLSEEELITFKEKWANDPAFVADVKAGITLKAMLKVSGELKETGITSQPAGRQVRMKKRPGAPLKWAASVLLVAGIGMTVWLRSTSDIYELTKKHVLLYRLQAERDAISHETDTMNLINQAVVSYVKGDIEKALNLLKTGWTKNKSSGAYPAMLGDIYLTREQPDSALHYYNQIPQTFLPNDPVTQWNMVIIWLHKGEIKKARALLVEINKAPYDESYEKRSKDLLEAIDAPGFLIKNWLFN
ncbi:hypothetical protein FNH22_30120 [Fulvivirga sp. M361]|uniref:tetratricopeptide repeat protein n=1 Tax=Fulvivirga sp. M361 TaxID=2594266 RepID=UPI00117A1205|nr:hypothetical protein [Fulvivirga sp. M361]TRX47246.1 hypothetical protein FNH22_30120 [Fulvivirga sp. M361]